MEFRKASSSAMNRDWSHIVSPGGGRTRLRSRRPPSELDAEAIAEAEEALGAFRRSVSLTNSHRSSSEKQRPF
jgi:hypothetical protein